MIAHHTIRLAFFSTAIVWVTNVNHTVAQHKFFAPFDCRQHAELYHLEPVEAAPSTTIQEEPFVPLDTINGWKAWGYVENFSFGKNRGDLPMIIELNALHPYFRDRITAVIQECKAKGIQLAIVETYRTPAKQQEYQSMGKRYTRSGAGKSKHQYGLAIDVVPMIDSVAIWDNPVLWRKVGVIGEKYGLRWGGRWKYPYDPGHFEWTNGLPPEKLFAGEFPIVPFAEEHYPCLEEDLRLLRKYWKAWDTNQSSITRR